MINLELRTHPSVLFAYSQNYVDLIIRVENAGDNNYWSEADIIVPERLSLSPDGNLRKGRMRIGILGKNEFIEKAAKVYANAYTNPQIYRCKVVLYSYNRDGVIEGRLEKSVDVRCELKKPPTL
jgi:hypothetical protein